MDYPTRNHATPPRKVSRRFLNKILVVAVDPVDPASSIENPACIKNTADPKIIFISCVVTLEVLGQS